MPADLTKMKGGEGSKGQQGGKDAAAPPPAPKKVRLVLHPPLKNYYSRELGQHFTEGMIYEVDQGRAVEMLKIRTESSERTPEDQHVFAVWEPPRPKVEPVVRVAQVPARAEQAAQAKDAAPPAQPSASGKGVEIATEAEEAEIKARIAAAEAAERGEGQSGTPAVVEL